MIYDLVIVGGGPAGATLASLLNKNIKALLIEGDGAEKTCGGLLSPDAQEFLARLGRTLPLDVLVDPQIFSVRTIDLHTKKECTYFRNYLNMRRKAFDDWMLSFIPAHIETIKGVVNSIEALPSGFLLTCRKDGTQTQIRTRKLVGADGAGSIVRRTFFPPLETEELVAFQQWFPVSDESQPPLYTALFDKKTSSACSWTIQKGEHVLFGGIFPKDHTRQRFEEQKEKLRSVGFEFRRPMRSEGCKVLKPHSQKSFQCGSQNIFLIGEAAGFISPSSFEGISYAMKSAYYLSESLKTPNPSQSYFKMTTGLRNRLLLKLLKARVMYSPMLRSLALQTGLTGISPIE